MVGGKTIRRSRQAQGFGGQSPDALAVHGQTRRPRRGHHPQAAVALKLDQRLGVDGLDLGHHQVGLFLADQLAQQRRVEHVQGVATVRHLHGRRVVVAVGGDHFHAQALQLDGYFLAQFTAAQQQHTEAIGRKRRAQADRIGHFQHLSGDGTDCSGQHCAGTVPTVRRP